MQEVDNAGAKADCVENEDQPPTRAEMVELLDKLEAESPGITPQESRRLVYGLLVDRESKRQVLEAMTQLISVMVVARKSGDDAKVLEVLDKFLDKSVTVTVVKDSETIH